MKNKITYFLTRFSMFGLGSYLLFQNCGKDAWISVILGTILGVIMLYVYYLIKKNLHKETLSETLKKTPLGKFYLFLLVIFYLYLFIIILEILTTFVNSFYLRNTPTIFINLPFVILAVYVTYKGRNTLENLSHLFFFLSIPIIIIFAFFLTKSINISYLMPIMDVKYTSILKSSLIFGSIISIPQILTIDYDCSFKEEIKDYIVGCLSTFIIIFFTTICLGEPLLKIYSFPEYSVLKQIKVLKFIENVENISAFIWYFDLFIPLCTICLNIKKSLSPKYQPVKFTFLLTLAFIISTFILSANYRFKMISFYTYPYVLMGFALIFITLLFYLKITNKNTLKKET